mmetsp:Transcript_38248/g.108129  ORF Transcript_38248/g.108129 Transcript_38248/m.108129 type:complete len:202 (+) Transcript_38248:536-1141(+)
MRFRILCLRSASEALSALTCAMAISRSFAGPGEIDRHVSLALVAASARGSPVLLLSQSILTSQSFKVPSEEPDTTTVGRPWGVAPGPAMWATPRMRLLCARTSSGQEPEAMSQIRMTPSSAPVVRMSFPSPTMHSCRRAASKEASSAPSPRMLRICTGRRRRSCRAKDPIAEARSRGRRRAPPGQSGAPQGRKPLPCALSS